MPIALPGGEKVLNIIDVPGHYHMMERLNEAIDDSKSIILMLDSKEKEKFREAAEILYEILNNLTVLSERTPIVIACNKQDLIFAKKATTVEVELEKEIEELRRVKKATLTDDDTRKMRYLETQKKRFSFAEIGNGITVKFIECSVKNGEIDDIYRFINSSFF
jgi:signal recognition particle receptor subunit beta